MEVHGVIKVFWNEECKGHYSTGQIPFITTNEQLEI